MEQNNTQPTEIWGRYMDYLYNTAIRMRKIYREKINKGEQITDAELDDINKRVHQSLDIIVAKDNNANNDLQSQNESKQNKQLIRLTESDLRNIVKESINIILLETYNSDLYHFTNLEGIYGILGSNSISLMPCGDDEYDKNNEVVCLSRTKNPYIGYTPNAEYDLIFRITLDANKMSSSIRGMKIKPWSMNNSRTTVSYWNGKKQFNTISDYEERAYKDIEPLNKYCKSIDVFPYTKGYKFDKEQIEILNKLIKDFPQWKNYFNWSQ